MRIILVVSLLCALSSCSSWNKFNNTEKGAVIGGGSGVVVGNLVSPGVGGTVVGGALGALGGGVIGNETDREKRRDRY